MKTKKKKPSYRRQLNPLAPHTVLHWTICWWLFLLRFSVDAHKWVFRPKITLLTREKKNKHKHHQGHLLLSDNSSDRTIGMIFSSWFELILCSIGFQHQYSGLLWHNDQKSEHPRQNKVFSFPSQRWSGIMVKNAALLNNSICLGRKHT